MDAFLCMYTFLCTCKILKHTCIYIYIYIYMYVYIEVYLCIYQDMWLLMLLTIIVKSIHEPLNGSCSDIDLRAA